MSASALSDVMKAVKAEGLPDLQGRNHLREARDHICAEPTPFGPICQEITCAGTDGSTKRIPIAHPAAFLFMALTVSASFNELFASRLDVNPSSPEQQWNLVLYSDEATPGSVLASSNKRKFQAVYWTCLEFGDHALSREESWFCILTE